MQKNKKQGTTTVRGRPAWMNEEWNPEGEEEQQQQQNDSSTDESEQDLKTKKDMYVTLRKRKDNKNMRVTIRSGTIAEQMFGAKDESELTGKTKNKLFYCNLYL